MQITTDPVLTMYRGVDAHHSSYPPAQPLTQTWLYLVMGGVSERLVKIIFPLWYLAGVMLMWWICRRCSSQFVALGWALLLATTPLYLDHATLGNADLPLAVVMLLGARIEGVVPMGTPRSLVKWCLRQLAGAITGQSIPDLNSGLRAIRRDALLLLRTNTEAILHPDPSFGELRQAVLTLTNLYTTLTNFSDDPLNRERSRDTMLPSGKALSPLNAVQCLGDFLRVVRYVQGLHAAIHVARARFPGQCIEVLYAGSGPFAPLALPLMATWSPAQVRFTIIDIHPESVALVGQLLNRLGLTAFVRDVCVADATTYHHPTTNPLHIVITETMQRALDKEPQVAIMLNLAPQLQPGGIFIPERVTVSASLVSSRDEFAFGETDGEAPNRVRLSLGTLLDLGLDSLDALWLPKASPSDVSGIQFPAVNITLPAEVPATMQLMLLTHITTFGSFKLGDYDSHLTYPFTPAPLRSVAPGTTITCQYQLGAVPGFAYLLPTAPSALLT